MIDIVSDEPQRSRRAEGAASLRVAAESAVGAVAAQEGTLLSEGVSPSQGASRPYRNADLTT